MILLRPATFIRLVWVLIVAAIFISVPVANGDSLSAQARVDTDRLQAAQAVRDHEYSQAFSAYVDMLSLNPSDSDTRGSLLQLMALSTPLHVPVDSIQHLPAQTVPFTIEASRTEAGTHDSAGYQTDLFVLSTPLPSEPKDPQQSWPFDNLLCVYRTTGDGGPAVLVADVHYQLTDDQALAERTGRLLALLDLTLKEKLQRPRADDNQPFHVWLCRQAPVSNGGEQWENNLYFYDVGVPRSSIEWIREIAHEFSHLAFPPVGGDYSEPESWANGYMGERLLVRWLSRDGGGGPASVQQDWGETFAGYANFDRLLIKPALAAFQTNGLDQKRLDARDADGMRYFIGMILTIDDRCGSAAVGDLLGILADQHQTSPSLLLDPAAQLLHMTPVKHS